jgi:hypothetical protein
MSTGGKVDTVESLREELESFKNVVDQLGEQDNTRMQRVKQLDMIDKYVLALLPALVAKHTNHYALAYEAFEIAQVLADHRDGFIDCDDLPEIV